MKKRMKKGRKWHQRNKRMKELNKKWNGRNKSMKKGQNGMKGMKVRKRMKNGMKG